MCVISIVQKARPSIKMVDQMFDQNDAGAGIAWRENGHVRWAKGLNLKEIQSFCRTVPLPYVAHFRIPTCGGAIKQLCHPFPIHKDSSLALEGTIKGSVLFHNGHWANWKDHVITALVKGHLQLPKGKWSDSRAMAWISAHYGLGMLELIDEKAVAFGVDDIEIIGTTGNGNWTYVDDIWCSNTIWQRTRFSNNNDWSKDKEWDMDQRKWVDKKVVSKDVAEKEDEKKGDGGENEADRRLPQHYVDGGAGITKLPVPLLGDGEQAGGTASETPFEQAKRAWAAGKLSKKAWKRAQKKHDKLVRKAAGAILNRLNMKQGSHIKDGVIVH